jgi:hypothetical protein
MHRITWLAAVAMAAAPAAAAQGQTGTTSPTAQAVAGAREIASDLREARDLLKGVLDRQKRERLELLLTRAELKAVDVQKTLTPLATPAAPKALTAEQFAKALQAVKSPPFDDARLTVVEALCLGNRFSSAQVRDMLKEFKFDDGRVKAAVAIYPRVIDPQSYNSVLDVFVFESHRRTVRERLKLK